MERGRLPIEQELHHAQRELRDALSARVPSEALEAVPALVETGEHAGLRDVVNPAETDAGISFLIGRVSGLHTALHMSGHRLRRLRADERAAVSEMIAAVAESLPAELPDLDDLGPADEDHHINYFYGRLAAFDAVLQR